MLTSNGYVLDEHPDRLGRLEPVPASERSSRTDLLGRLDRDGYLYLRGFLDPMIVEGFRDYYFAALQPAGLDQRQRHDVPLDTGLLRQILFADIVPGRAYLSMWIPLGRLSAGAGRSDLPGRQPSPRTSRGGRRHAPASRRLHHRRPAEAG